MDSQIIIFSFMAGLLWFSLYAYSPQVADYAKELGASYKMIGMITGAYGLSQSLFRIPFGTASDILNKRKIFIQLGFICTIVSPIIAIFIKNEYALLFSRFIAGIGSATWVNFTVVFSSYFEEHETVKASGILSSVNKFGQLLAVALGGLVANYFGLNSVFAISVYGGIVGYVLSFFMKESFPRTNSYNFEFSDFLYVACNKYVMYVSFLGTVVQLVTYGTTFCFTPLIAIELGANNSELSLVIAFFILPQVIFSFVGATIFVKKFSEVGTLIIGFIASAISCLIIPYSVNLFMLYTIQIFNGIGYALTFPLLMGLVIKHIKLGLRNTAMAFFQSIHSIGIIAGPIILGSLIGTYGFKTGYTVIGLAGIACTTLLFYRRKQAL